MSELDELLIQQCVDGELPVARQQQLLASIDHAEDAEERWKQLALAYVEEQQWQQAFQQKEQTAIVGEHACSSDRPVVRSTNRNGRSMFLTQLTWVAIALVGGVLIGDVWRGSRQSGARSLAAAGAKEESKDNAVAGSAVPAGKDMGLVKDDGGSYLELPNSSGESVRVPMRSLDEIGGQFDVLPAELRRRLEAGGYEFEEADRYLIFESDGNRPMIVPLPSVRIKPRGL